jgi:simple sugar transport system ATP-binding protein
MYFGAKLIILDEPTSALSIKEARKVLNYVEVANERGISVIIISHNIHHILPISHQIAVIYRGRLLTTVNRGDHNATAIENLIMHGVPALEEAMEGV